jgi:hypothetical protein
METAALKAGPNNKAGIENPIRHVSAFSVDAALELKAVPDASLGKIAADFTDLEQSPIGLLKSENGVWFATIPLLPGQYVYRFIADGIGGRIDVSPDPRQVRMARWSPCWRSPNAGRNSGSCI